MHLFYLSGWKSKSSARYLGWILRDMEYLQFCYSTITDLIWRRALDPNPRGNVPISTRIISGPSIYNLPPKRSLDIIQGFDWQNPRME
jgi:hypothetical protein